jgi:hypothetical protein
MNIGDRVKHKDQNITGVIVRYDIGSKVVVLDDDDSWQEEGEEPTLVFRMSDLEIIED